MKKLLKILIILTTIAIISINIPLNNCYAGPKDPNEEFEDEWKEEEKQKLLDGTFEIIKPDDYKPNVNPSSILAIKVDVIVGAIRIIGSIVSIIVLMLIGFKTMTGSVEQKAEYKKALPGYLLGAFMVFAITALPTFIYNIVKDF